MVSFLSINDLIKCEIIDKKEKMLHKKSLRLPLVFLRGRHRPAGFAPPPEHTEYAPEHIYRLKIPLPNIQSTPLKIYID